MHLKINLLHIANQLGPGGTEKAMQIFCQNLNKEIFNVYICAVVKGGPRREILYNSGYSVGIVECDQEALIKFMQEKEIMIVHYHDGLDSFVLEAAKRAKVPIIVKTNIFGFLNKSTTEIDHQFFVSKMCAFRYQTWIGADDREFLRRNSILYNPLDFTEFEETGLSGCDLRKYRRKMGIGDNDSVIGRIGRVDAAKFGGISLDMIPYLFEMEKNFKYVIVGASEATKKKVIKRNLPNIIFLDYIPENELKKFYDTIDILAHSSFIGESFGYVLAEAMAAKKPIVVNSTPLVDNAQIELVDNGINGFIVYSPKGYAHAINYLIKNNTEAQDMGLAGYRKAKNEYDCRNLIKILEYTYFKLIIEKKLDIDTRLFEYFNTIDVNAIDKNHSDYLTFKQTYTKRLENSYDKVDNLNILIYKIILNKPLIWRFLSSKLRGGRTQKILENFKVHI